MEMVETGFTCAYMTYLNIMQYMYFLILGSYFDATFKKQQTFTNLFNLFKCALF